MFWLESPHYDNTVMGRVCVIRHASLHFGGNTTFAQDSSVGHGILPFKKLFQWVIIFLVVIWDYFIPWIVQLQDPLDVFGLVFLIASFIQ